MFHTEGSFHPLEVFQHVAGTAELIWAAAGDVAGDPAMLRLLPKLGTYLDISGMGADEVARALEPLRPDGVITFMDRHLRLVAGVAQRLGLAYHTPEVARRLVDKRLQRESLAVGGVPGPRYWPVPGGTTGADLAVLASQVGYPAVVKPAEGSDSRGVALARRPEDLAALVPPEGALVESLLAEREGTPPWRSGDLRVESVVQDGVPQHLVVRGVFPVTEPFRLTGTFLPADLTAQESATVLAVVSRAIEALGITTGVVDTELRSTPDGPAVIEVNGRVAGTVPFLLADVSEVDMFQLACRVAAGLPHGLTGPAVCRCVAFSWRAHPPVWARRLVAVDGVEQLKAAVPEISSVNVRLGPGAAVDWRQGTRSLVAIVQGRAASHADLARAVSAIAEHLRPSYE